MVTEAERQGRSLRYSLARLTASGEPPGPTTTVANIIKALQNIHTKTFRTKHGNIRTMTNRHTGADYEALMIKNPLVRLAADVYDMAVAGYSAN